MANSSNKTKQTAPPNANNQEITHQRQQQPVISSITQTPHIDHLVTHISSTYNTPSPLVSNTNNNTNTNNTNTHHLPPQSNSTSTLTQSPSPGHSSDYQLQLQRQHQQLLSNHSTTSNSTTSRC